MVTALQQLYHGLRRRRLTETRIGVDVGTHALKLAQVSRANDRWVLENHVILPVRQPEPLQPADITQHAIREILADTAGCLRPGTATAGCVMSMALGDFRSLELPAADDYEMRNMVRAELEGEDGWSADRFVFDFWTGLTTTGNLIEVPLLSYRRDMTEAMAEDLVDAGMRCRTLDGLPFALSRAVAMSERSSSTPIAALDWGGTAVTLTIAVGGRPRFTRSFRGCGLESVLQQMEGRFHTSRSDCWQLLQRFGIRTDRSSEIGHAVAETISEPLRRVGDELRRTCAFLQRTAPQLAPASIQLFGGGATVSGIADHLRRLVDAPVAIWQLNGDSQDDTANPIEAVLGPAIALSPERIER